MIVSLPTSSPSTFNNRTERKAEVYLQLTSAGWGRIALLPFWALFWGQKSLLKRDFWKIPFLPLEIPLSALFWGYMALLMNHQSLLNQFYAYFSQDFCPNLIDNYYPVKFPALRASFSTTESCWPVYVLLVSIFKRYLVRTTSGMAQTSFGSGFIAKSSIIFYF